MKIQEQEFFQHRRKRIIAFSSKLLTVNEILKLIWHGIAHIQEEVFNIFDYLGYGPLFLQCTHSKNWSDRNFDQVCSYIEYVVVYMGKFSSFGHSETCISFNISRKNYLYCSF